MVNNTSKDSTEQVRTPVFFLKTPSHNASSVVLPDFPKAAKKHSCPHIRSGALAKHTVLSSEQTCLDPVLHLPRPLCPHSGSKAIDNSQCQTVAAAEPRLCCLLASVHPSSIHGGGARL